MAAAAAAPRLTRQCGAPDISNTTSAAAVDSGTGAATDLPPGGGIGRQQRVPLLLQLVDQPDVARADDLARLLGDRQERVAGGGQQVAAARRL